MRLCFGDGLNLLDVEFLLFLSTCLNLKSHPDPSQILCMQLFPEYTWRHVCMCSVPYYSGICMLIFCGLILQHTTEITTVVSNHDMGCMLILGVWACSTSWRLIWLSVTMTWGVFLISGIWACSTSQRSPLMSVTMTWGVYWFHGFGLVAHHRNCHCCQ